MTSFRLVPVRVAEQIEAESLWRWVESHVRRYPELRLLHHVPNGDSRSPQAGARLRASGLRPGVVDYILDWPRLEYLGLRLELKSQTGALRPLQVCWGGCYESIGYYWTVARGWKEASEQITAYLGMGDPAHWDGPQRITIQRALIELGEEQTRYELQRLKRKKRGRKNSRQRTQ